LRFFQPKIAFAGKSMIRISITLDRVWAEEAERRIDELDSGKVQALPGEQVFGEIRKWLGK